MTQPALLPGRCSRPPQDSDSEFRVVFLAAVRAKLEQRGHSHISPHASAGIVSVFVFFVINIPSVRCERRLTFHSLFHHRCLFIAFTFIL